MIEPCIVTDVPVPITYIRTDDGREGFAYLHPVFGVQFASDEQAKEIQDDWTSWRTRHTRKHRREPRRYSYRAPNWWPDGLEPMYPPPGMTTALYRHFDQGGLPLYIGISDDLVTRQTSHRSRSPWWGFSVRAVVTWYSSREEAEAAEAAAIAEDEPLFNKRHASSDAYSRLALYLVEKGRLDLLNSEEPRG